MKWCPSTVKKLHLSGTPKNGEEQSLVLAIKGINQHRFTSGYFPWTSTHKIIKYYGRGIEKNPVTWVAFHWLSASPAWTVSSSTPSPFLRRMRRGRSGNPDWHAPTWTSMWLPFLSPLLLGTLCNNNYYLFKAKPSQPHRVTSGLFTISNLRKVEYNIKKHAHFTNVKHI